MRPATTPLWRRCAAHETHDCTKWVPGAGKAMFYSVCKRRVVRGGQAMKVHRVIAGDVLARDLGVRPDELSALGGAALFPPPSRTGADYAQESHNATASQVLAYVRCTDPPRTSMPHGRRRTRETPLQISRRTEHRPEDRRRPCTGSGRSAPAMGGIPPE